MISVQINGKQVATVATEAEAEAHRPADVWRIVTWRNGQNRMMNFITRAF